MGWGRRREEEDEEYKLWCQVPSQDVLSFLLFYQGIGEDSLREREKDEGRGSKTPIDPLSCSQRCKPSSGTSSTEARGGSPGRQKGETR